MFHVKQFDVIVIGGGHAGCEAACAAARAGVSVALVTMRESDLGAMSCNPAVGGLGKGHLVREIDALGGVMGRIADAAGIQFRLLNRKKGPAVQGPRAQVDRIYYASLMRSVIKRQKGLSVICAEVTKLDIVDGQVCGVILRGDEKISASAVVITTGTFLRGKVFIGAETSFGGRIGSDPSVALAQQMQELGFEFARLKTGTPPRLRKSTIDWAQLEFQPGDEDPTFFSFLSSQTTLPQLSCGITYTNATTHEIISENIEKSAMYGGHIDGVGPRYCPSIEDKVMRFADRSAHQIFLEPESYSTDWIYPNGISTSLPLEVQQRYVTSIAGLEQAEIIQPGYAIEYDYCDPRKLNSFLTLPDMEGLFLAGQINGTTGYEEAAAQGLIAGLNAARLTKGEEMVRFSRADSYLGVLIDDLTTMGVKEPYRMFTSRAEYRLSLRADNADQRLTELGRQLGLVDDARYEVFSRKRDQIETLRAHCDDTFPKPADLELLGLGLKKDGKKRSLYDLLSIPGFEVSHARASSEKFASFDDGVQDQIKRDATYANYIERQNRSASLLRSEENMLIPEGFDYRALVGLSSELAGKLERFRPESVHHAKGIDGMTPAALLIIIAKLRSGSTPLKDVV